MRAREPVVAAVDVGGTAAKTGLVTATGRVVTGRTFLLEHLRGKPGLVEEIVRICTFTVASGRDAGDVDVVAVGLTVPGIVDPAARRGISSMLLGWRDVAFGELVQAACGLPTAVDHDVRTAARAEFHHGPWADPADALFVTLGTGVGAASRIGGAIRTGGHGYGGEIAHLVVDPAGPPCPCGKRGCVEVTSSGVAIARAYRARTGHDVDARVVATRAADGEPAAREIWHHATVRLGQAIGNYCEILDPTVVILGGGVSGAGELLLAPVTDAVRASLSLPFAPELALASLGPQAGMRGAAMLGFDRLKQAA